MAQEIKQKDVDDFVKHAKALKELFNNSLR